MGWPRPSFLTPNLIIKTGKFLRSFRNSLSLQNCYGELRYSSICWETCMRVVLFISGHKTVQNCKLIVEPILLTSLFCCRVLGQQRSMLGNWQHRYHVFCIVSVYTSVQFLGDTYAYMYGTAPVGTECSIEFVLICRQISAQSSADDAGSYSRCLLAWWRIQGDVLVTLKKKFHGTKVYDYRPLLILECN